MNTLIRLSLSPFPSSFRWPKAPLWPSGGREEGGGRPAPLPMQARPAFQSYPLVQRASPGGQAADAIGRPRPAPAARPNQGGQVAGPIPGRRVARPNTTSGWGAAAADGICGLAPELAR